MFYVICWKTSTMGHGLHEIMENKITPYLLCVLKIEKLTVTNLKQESS